MLIIKKGDLVTRMLCGTMPDTLKVTKITEELIHCGPWTFCPKTGAEIDEDLDWGPPPLSTGSFLKEITDHNKTPIHKED